MDRDKLRLPRQGLMGVRPGRPRIGILLTGQTLTPIRERCGDFARWFQERAGAPAEYQVHALHTGDAVPSTRDSEGWIISGSPDSVNDPLAWLPPAKERIAQAVAAGHPILGVCFGHQLLATATGGAVGLNPKGWELGAGHVQLTSAGTSSPLFQGLDPVIPVYASHKEVVSRLPDGAEVLGENEMGMQAFQLGDHAFGVQFHPEFSAQITRMYVKLRMGVSEAASGIDEHHGDPSHNVLTNYIRFILQ